MDVNGIPLNPQPAGHVMTGGGHTTNAHTGANANNKLRKRTKTGCLTCRKRRIKCGEEKPTCHNCTKSKRPCEGYSQRVVWKTGSLPDWPGIADDGTTLPYHNGMLPPQAGAFSRPIPPPPIDTAAFMQSQSQDDQAVGVNERGELIFSPPSAGYSYGSLMNGNLMTSPRNPQLPPAWPLVSPQYPVSTYATEPMSAAIDRPLYTHIPSATSLQTPLSASSHYGSQHSQDPTWGNTQPQGQVPDLPTPSSAIPQDLNRAVYDDVSMQAFDHSGTRVDIGPPEGPFCVWDSAARASTLMSKVSEDPWSQTNNQHSVDEPSTFPVNAIVPGPILSPPVAPIPQQARFIGHSLAGTTAQFLEEAAVEYHDDDYWDVLSDDEIDAVPDDTSKRTQRGKSDLSLILALHQEHLDELNSRRYDTFLYSRMLDEYRPEESANPLRNRATARVFAHFIFATGPSLSIFERRSRNPSAMFTKGTTQYQQGLWTYTLPMMAIKHQGLLHAMLALSSLHISKLQGTDNTSSYKHYAYAIKRIHRSVGNMNKKLLPTTVAATLLLGFYEILTADHLKWSSHLAGARQLLCEIPFRRMARQASQHKARESAQKEEFGLFNASIDDYGNYAASNVSVPVDENLLGIMFGRQPHYDYYRGIYGQTDDDDPDEPSVPFDLARYELYQDLYWWYARQDAYQAILSGNNLLLDYDKWTDCPPRAALGRPEAIYGTHDHLILLLARVADFNARDRKRKIKVMEANGGHWLPPGTPRGRPPPSVDPSCAGRATPAFIKSEPVSGSGVMPSGSALGHSALTEADSGTVFQGQPPNVATAAPNFTPTGQGPMTPQRPPPVGPSFYGMAPLPVKVHMPSSYRTKADMTPSPQSEQSDYDVDLATHMALQEWSEIRAALTTFENHLGPHFQPLPADTYVASMTPFGPALFYRSHDIAVLWAMYYMTSIIAQRCHPHMPPAAMMAAGVAAQQTAQYSMKIGTIVGGIIPALVGADLSPILGSCLCECSLPLFFSGVQMQAAEQRQWLISLLRDVELRTGWKSVGMVAQGCETSWEKAAEMGAGPPYKRPSGTWHAYGAGRAFIAARSAGDEDADADRDWTRPGNRVHYAMGLLSVEENADESKSRHVGGTAPSRG